MGHKVANGLSVEKKIFIDLKEAIGQMVDGLKTRWVTAKKIFIDLRIGSRVRAAFTPSVRFVRRQWIAAGGFAFLFIVLANSAAVTDNAWKLYDGGWRLWSGISPAEIKKQKEAYEEAESTRLYDVINLKKAPLKVAIDSANITPSKGMILAAYQAHPGWETTLVALRQGAVVDVLRADPAAAAAANNLIDELDQAIVCRTDRCDTEAFDRDWSPALCNTAASLRGWIEYRRENEDPSFAKRFTTRVDAIKCEPYLYGAEEPSIS